MYKTRHREFRQCIFVSVRNQLVNSYFFQLLSRRNAISILLLHLKMFELLLGYATSIIFSFIIRQSNAYM